MEIRNNLWDKYSYAWITLLFFVLSFIGHWIFAWQAYVQDQASHNEEVVFEEYLIQTGRDTFENWQSEFLQLLWQVGGLALLLYLGSPQSKEGDERIEEKLDLILKKLDKSNGEKLVKKIDKRYLKK